VNREFCEDGEVVRWRAIGHRASSTPFMKVERPGVEPATS